MLGPGRLTVLGRALLEPPHAVVVGVSGDQVVAAVAVDVYHQPRQARVALAGSLVEGPLGLVPLARRLLVPPLGGDHVGQLVAIHIPDRNAVPVTLAQFHRLELRLTAVLAEGDSDDGGGQLAVPLVDGQFGGAIAIDVLQHGALAAGLPTDHLAAFPELPGGQAVLARVAEPHDLVGEPRRGQHVGPAVTVEIDPVLAVVGHELLVVDPNLAQRVLLERRALKPGRPGGDVQHAVLVHVEHGDALVEVVAELLDLPLDRDHRRLDRHALGWFVVRNQGLRNDQKENRHDQSAEQTLHELYS